MNEDRKPWCPPSCPITGQKFFMWIDGPDGEGLVPTYGGPYDSYTLPELERTENYAPGLNVGEWTRMRFDHDEGSWVDGAEGLGLILIEENDLLDDDLHKRLHG